MVQTQPVTTAKKIQALEEALQIITVDRGIRNWLVKTDPNALEKAARALALAYEPPAEKPEAMGNPGEDNPNFVAEDEAAWGMEGWHICDYSQRIGRPTVAHFSEPTASGAGGHPVAFLTYRDKLFSVTYELVEQ